MLYCNDRLIVIVVIILVLLKTNCEKMSHKQSVNIDGELFGPIEIYRHVIIVGGGLGGLSAAIEASRQPGTRITVLEKEKKLGGNSAKATSGINAALTDVQLERGR